MIVDAVVQGGLGRVKLLTTAGGQKAWPLHRYTQKVQKSIQAPPSEPNPGQKRRLVRQTNKTRATPPHWLPPPPLSFFRTPRHSLSYTTHRVLSLFMSPPPPVLISPTARTVINHGSRRWRIKNITHVCTCVFRGRMSKTQSARRNNCGHATQWN